MIRLWKRAASRFAIVFVALVGVTSLGWPAAREDGEDSLYRHLSIFTEVLSLVQRAYVDEPDVGALFAGGLEGITDALDAMADYVPPAGVPTFERSREIGVSHSGLWVTKDRGIPFVFAVDRGSPAARAGLKRGDILTTIDGADARTMALWEIRGRLAQAPGTPLEMEILRLGQARESSLVLALYEVPVLAVEEREGIPILRIGHLDRAAVEALRARLGELTAAGATRLILDLRGAAGGDPDSAYAAAGLFTEGELGRLVKRETTLRTFVDDAPPVWSGSLLVLIDRSSQGAAEILASVLAQRTGAELVGERTFGHAGRESVRTLSNGALLVLSDAFYTGPDNAVLDAGLEPGIRVSESSRRFGESEVPIGELILERALERARAAGDRS